MTGLREFSFLRRRPGGLFSGRPLATCTGLCLALALTGCQGVLGNSGEEAALGEDGVDEVDGSENGALGAGKKALNCETPQGSRSLPRRLTQREYRNSIESLLGSTIDYETVLTGDSTSGPFATNHGSPASTLSVEKYLLAAEEIAAAAADNLDDVLPCEPGDRSEECARAFVDSFARLAYRGTLDDTAAELLMDSFRSASAADGFASGLSLIIEKVLQSPYFLYHIEKSEPGDGSMVLEPLTGYSVASKLAAFIWEGIPDAELLQAAERGDLANAEGVRAQALRMMKDDRAAESFVSFIEQWFQLPQLSQVQKSQEEFPEFSPSLVNAMRQETATFVRWMLQNDQFSMEQLFTSNHAFPGTELADYYGVEPMSEGAPLEFEAEERYGILTHPSFTTLFSHTAETSVIRRGAFIRDHVLCQTLPEPPANVNTILPEVADGVSQRERLQIHTEDPSCAACHAFIDDLGFSLEHFDALGKYRVEEHGLDIDASGALTGTSADGDFSSAQGLVERLLESEETTECAVSQWTRFAQRRSASEHDLCSQRELVEEFLASGGDFQSLILSIVESTAFRFHDPSHQPEGAIL